MKKLFILILTLTVMFMITACNENDGGNDIGNDSGVNNKAKSGDGSNIAVFQLTPPADGTVGDTDDFLNILGERKSLYDDDVCYNVTPENISGGYGFNIFKFNQSCESYLMYENEIYSLGEYFGGFGTTSFAVADMNSDGSSELYFTYSWGSGMHRSSAGYFDTRDKKIVLFDFSYTDKDMVFIAENDSLSLYEAKVEIKSFVDITLLQGEEKIGDVVYDSDEIRIITKFMY